ncbi:MAG: trigger factor [Candidatus Margulisiibacteriota bacterium]
MSYTVKKLPKSEIEIKFEISGLEYQPYLEKAAAHISEHAKIEGFRPGKAPYEIVKKAVGEVKIYEEALEMLLPKYYGEAVEKENLQTIGQPKVNVEKLAPGNPMVFKLTVTLLPEVTLPDLGKLNFKRKDIKMEAVTVDKALGDLQKMRRQETVVARPAMAEDKVVVDLEMLKDKVAMEGGTAKDHAVYLNEQHYIPGFAEKLIGSAKGETREFNLPFPKDHYQKHLAGANIDFKATVKDVYELKAPEINDEFAKNLGQTDLASLRALVEQNLLAESKGHEEERVENEMLNELEKAVKISDIPELLLNEEIHKMEHELENNIARQGMEINQYLESIHKTMDDLKTDFAPQAIKRVKVALIIRAYGLEQKIEVNAKEIAEEVEKQMNMYKNDPKTQEAIRDPEYADYLSTILRNRKTLAWLKDKLIK